MTGGNEETEVKQYAKVYKRMPTTKKRQTFSSDWLHKKSRGEEKNWYGNEIVMLTYNKAKQIAEENTEKNKNNICK